MAVRTVAIKGVRSSRYLCMDEAGRLHGQVSCDSHPGPDPLFSTALCRVRLPRGRFLSRSPRLKRQA